MEWENLGLIFTSKNLKSLDSDLEFAKSPQFLSINNKPYFFFTSQKRDEGKWIALPYWVEMSEDLVSIKKHSVRSVLDQGDLGTFDEHGIFPFSPTKIDDSNFIGYTTGWSRRKSVDIDMSIGFSVSHDGLAYKKIGKGPLLTHCLNEPMLVGDAFVRKFHGKFYMWYIYGNEWKKDIKTGTPERSYRISQATSRDGIDWKRDGGFVINQKSANECQALPSVTFFNNRFHMLFCHRDMFNFRSDKDSSYSIGYAYSTDLSNWHRDDGMVSSLISGDEWDNKMQCYPNIFTHNGSLYCAYNGNNFGKNGFGLARVKNI